MLPVAQRNALVAETRREVTRRFGLTLFPHQAEWSLASEGWRLLPRRPDAGERFVNVLIPNEWAPDDAKQAIIEPRAVIPRTGGVARVIFDLAAYKSGKSFSAALWMTGFAFLPDARIEIVGMEYGNAEPEFTYLEEFLLSEKGMNVKPALHHHDADHGHLQLVIPDGATYIVRSWARKDALKGKRVTAYVYAEAYQLPGIQCFTAVSQNLRQDVGWALFPTTPDSAWVGYGHDRGHGADPDWHCTCGVDARQNPFTYSVKDRARDDPEQGGIMTKEKYAISWCGQLGTYVGACYSFVRGQQQFSPLTHPQLWKGAT